MAWVLMLVLVLTPSPPYSGERAGVRGLEFAWLTPSPPTPLPRVQGRGEDVPDLDLRPNVGPEPMPPVTTWRAYVSLAMIGSGAILTSWLILIWLRRPRPVRIPPPDEWALAELDRLDKQPPVTDEDARRYCTQVSGILRQFLDRRFGFRAVEQTTPEFVASLQSANTLNQDQKESLIGLLKRTDLVKFAAVVPDAAERAELTGQVRDFIRVASALKTPPPPGS